MKHFNYILFLIVACLFSFSACEKAFIEPDHEDNPHNNFDYLWKEIDENYSYFELKKVNWDSLHWVYKDQVRNNMSDQELFDLMSEMLFQLKDGHVNLTSSFDRTRYWEWYLNSPQNFDYNLLERNYLEGEHKISRGGTYQYRILEGNIGYVYVPSFSKSNYANIDLVVDEFKDTKGMIIDIRDNSGGEVINAEILASRFADKTRLYALWLWKNGPGHDDFTDEIPYYIVQGGKYIYLRNVILLTNRSSFSAANDFTLMMKQFPHVTVIGDTTGGGGGVPYSSELPNGWSYRFPRTITLSPEGEHVEFGIPPDISVNMDSTSLMNGKDAILEKAFQLLD